MTKGVQVQSVSRAMEVLSLFEESGALGITEIAARMQLSKSTVYGLVNTLCAHGMLERTEGGRQYRLGVRLFQLGTLVHKRMDLHRDARPFCEELSQRHRLTVHLAARYGSEIVYIDKVDAPGSVIAYSQVGKCAPAHCTGVGKAILAFMPEAESSGWVSRTGMPAFTPHTMTVWDDLRRELEEIRRRGYALDREEIEEGLCCVAAPIFGDHKAPVAAVSVSGPSGRLTQAFSAELAPDVCAVAQSISRRLGYVK